jgi:SAM-dependent methyltransferase
MKKNIIIEKIKMLENNPKTILYWVYKFSNFFRKNVLNNGERYDPNILGKFNINDFHQEARYHLAKSFISQGDTVLDIACGTGYGALILADSALSVTGVDVSKESIRYANKHYKKNPKVNFVQSDIFNFKEGADVVISFETVEHINDTIEIVIKKLLSLARKKVVCSVPYKEPAGNNKYHVHFDISESTFDFLKKDYKVKFLYQSKDGKTWEEVKDDILTLVIVVDKFPEV